jgi:hypothetical protein
MGLRWESPDPPGLGPSLCYDINDRPIGRVHTLPTHPNAWGGWYDLAGADRAGAPMLGTWSTMREAQAAVDRHHDRVTA